MLIFIVIYFTIYSLPVNSFSRHDITFKVIQDGSNIEILAPKNLYSNKQNINSNIFYYLCTQMNLCFTDYPQDRRYIGVIINPTLYNKLHTKNFISFISAISEESGSTELTDKQKEISGLNIPTKVFAKQEDKQLLSLIRFTIENLMAVMEQKCVDLNIEKELSVICQLNQHTCYIFNGEIKLEDNKYVEEGGNKKECGAYLVDAGQIIDSIDPPLIKLKDVRLQFHKCLNKYDGKTRYYNKRPKTKEHICTHIMPLSKFVMDIYKRTDDNELALYAEIKEPYNNKLIADYYRMRRIIDKKMGNSYKTQVKHALFMLKGTSDVTYSLVDDMSDKLYNENKLINSSVFNVFDIYPIDLGYNCIYNGESTFVYVPFISNYYVISNNPNKQCSLISTHYSFEPTSNENSKVSTKSGLLSVYQMANPDDIKNMIETLS